MRDDLVHQAFALVGAADRHTAQRVAEAAAGGDNVHIVIVHAACVIKVCVPADPLGQKQFIDLVIGVAVGGIDLRNSVFGHGADPFISGKKFCIYNTTKPLLIPYEKEKYELIGGCGIIKYRVYNTWPEREHCDI